MIDKTVDAIPRPQAQSRLPFIQSSKFRSSRWIFNLALPLVVILSGGAWAHDSTRPPALRDVAFDQKLNQQVPLGLAFRDESGKTVQLADYIKQKPVILTFVYYKCRDLCPLLLDGVVRSLWALSFDAGNQFDLITLSIDAHDSPGLAAAKKKDIIDQYSRPGAATGWHFLTGDEAAIQKLTQSVGFHYTYDPHTGEFAHATGMVLLTPKGKTARYYYGIDFSPRDLRLGLIEAAAGKIGSPIDQLLLFCYHYDPVTGKYGLLITNVIRLAGAATMVMFVWGAKLFFVTYHPPSNSLEINVVAKQWMWKVQHPEGQSEIDELHIPLGRPIKLILTSQDVIHDFFVPAFRVKKDVLPGRYTTVWFEATKAGEYHLFCAQYCGTQHSGMVGRIVVMEPTQYQTWLGGGTTGIAMATAGAKLFQTLGCATCHMENDTGRGPSLVGLFGKTVQLQGGKSMVDDETDIRESILNPPAKVLTGDQH